MSTRDFINTLFPEYKDSESYFQELLMEKIKKLDDEISYYKKKDIENQILLTKMFKDNQKMLENIVDLCENTIKHQKDINKKVSLSFKWIEDCCNTGDLEHTLGFVTKNFIDIYNYDKDLFSRMISNDGLIDCNANISIFLFYEISFEEFDSILDIASVHRAKKNKSNDDINTINWFKLNLLNQSILVLHNVTLKDKHIVLTKFYKIFNNVELDSRKNEPYNSKKCFFGHPFFVKIYLEASEHFASKLDPSEISDYWKKENHMRQCLGVSFTF